jgi:Fe2+ or Zn2+ uptake regulation protein
VAGGEGGGRVGDGVRTECSNELLRHATAEEVLWASASRLPGLSLPTMYATLDLFARFGGARRVDGAGNATLYDPRTDAHPPLPVP